MPLVHLDDALEEVAGEPWPDELEDATTWGQPPTLWTWSGPQVAPIIHAQRDAELRVLQRGASVGPRALRELLALQASDWAFLETRALAGPYALERIEGHRAALAAALDSVPSADPDFARPRALRPRRTTARTVSRVLILSWEYPPVVEGGLARHVRKLSEPLVAHGPRSTS